MQDVQTRGMFLRVAQRWWLGKGENILERKGQGKVDSLNQSFYETYVAPLVLPRPRRVITRVSPRCLEHCFVAQKVQRVKIAWFIPLQHH